MMCIPPPDDRVAHIEHFNEYLARAVVKGEVQKPDPERWSTIGRRSRLTQSLPHTRNPIPL